MSSFRHLSSMLALLLASSTAIAVAPQYADVPQHITARLDFNRINAEDAAADHKGNPGGIRYAISEAVKVLPQRVGEWSTFERGRSIWRYRVTSADAVHINYGFARFRLPQSAQLRVLDGNGNALIRDLGAADNDDHGQYWTPPLPGADHLIELTINSAEVPDLELELSHIGVGYRGYGKTHAKAVKSGSCNTDVVCLASNDPWFRNSRSVGVLSEAGSRYCTGSLVNNTANDRKMYFITATHCEVTAGTAPSLVVVWNFQSPTCRNPGSTASGSGAVVGPLTQFNSGSIFRAATNNPFAGGGAAGTRSDNTLLELDDPADPAFNLYWAGWDRSNVGATCTAQNRCASIHHPNGDEKRITFSRTNLVQGNITSATGVHWFVQWDETPVALPNMVNPPVSLPPSITEPGSSGSPLYNASYRLVGVLSGGASFCGAGSADLNDLYGKIAHAWDGLGTPATRLRDWLDPGSTGLQTLNGIDGQAGGEIILQNGFE